MCHVPLSFLLDPQNTGVSSRLVLAVCGMWEGLGVLGENNILPVKKLTFRDISSPTALFNLLGSNSGFTTFPLDALEKWRWQFLAFSESSDVSTNFGLSHLGCHGTEGPIHTWMAPPSVVQEMAQPHITHSNRWALRAYHEPGPDGGWGFSREQADRAPCSHSIISLSLVAKEDSNGTQLWRLLQGLNNNDNCKVLRTAPGTQCWTVGS